MPIETINPWTSAIEHRYDLHSEAEVDARLARTAAAFGDWSTRSLADRGAHLLRLARVIRDDRGHLARLVSDEMGKLRREAHAEIEKSAAACEHYAEHAESYLRETHIATEATRSYVAYEPLGPILAVMPWNFPVWQVFRFLAPTLMVGNVALLKHASNVPRCAEAIAAAVERAGMPAGVLSVLHVDNATCARVIGDPRVRAVTLTGSEGAGRAIAETAGRHLKKSVLELGGSDPFLVLDDADLEATARAAARSRFGNAGQTCIAAKRFIVTEKVADAFVARFVSAAAALAVGDPNDDATNLAPMARTDLRDALHRQVEASVAAGAKVLIGCEPGARPCAYPASILDLVKPGMPAYHEELFGPVASVLRVRDEAAAIEVANDTTFGLGASIWTIDQGRGEAVARRLQAGACFVNTETHSDVRLPFGGTKRSGYGRELAEYGIREVVNVKSVYVR